MKHRKMFNCNINFLVAAVLVIIPLLECSPFMSWFYSGSSDTKTIRDSNSIIDYGECSHYGDETTMDMGRTQSGELYNPHDLTAAHRTLPINSYVTVTNERTKRTVVVRINDRGPNVDGRIMDLSASAFNQIADLDEAVIPCTLQIK